MLLAVWQHALYLDERPWLAGTTLDTKGIEESHDSPLGHTGLCEMFDEGEYRLLGGMGDHLALLWRHAVAIGHLSYGLPTAFFSGKGASR